MKCPYCGNEETKVIDKRDSETEAITRRRRECLKCEKRFTTYERVENINLVVVKKDGNREQFDRQKLERGILKASEKRPIEHEKLKSLIDEIEVELRNKEEIEIKSSEIGNLVIKRLKKLDKIAYIRFASVYRQFEDVEDFKDELNKLK